MSHLPRAQSCSDRARTSRSSPAGAQAAHARGPARSAALLLLKDTSFGSLSLREVTREAGVVPTAFYRHFANMEELGLALVDESFRTLRADDPSARAEATARAT